jgi:hypothetical protein
MEAVEKKKQVYHRSHRPRNPFGFTYSHSSAIDSIRIAAILRIGVVYPSSSLAFVTDFVHVWLLTPPFPVHTVCA